MQSDIERLRQQNAVLREENAQLRMQLEKERLHIVADGLDRGPRDLEIDYCKELIREQDAGATILGLYDELARLNRQCAVYADALEEARGNFVEMKRLYGELNHLLDLCNS